MLFIFIFFIFLQIILLVNAFVCIPPLASEESDWLSHLPGHSSQKQESQALSSTGVGGIGQLSSDVTVTPQDSLESVLQKLSLGDHLLLFKVFKRLIL